MLPSHYSLKKKMIIFIDIFIRAVASQSTVMHHPRNAGGVEVKTFASKRGGLAPEA
jgi:hypothetical protein